ncbi:MAG: PVC-type heme-binding CxxCH protein [Planctomycetaceae bacterium]
MQCVLAQTASCAWILIAALSALPSIDAAEPPTVELNGQTFTLPTGFEIEVVAGQPLVDRPITAAFDEQGRLYVTDSSGSNDKVDKQLAEKPHRIVRLSDTDGDGRFDVQTVFADKMMFPEGSLWYDGSLYVTAPPSIWKLTDTDGDGVADLREEWFKGQTLTGCANDLHGPYLGRDGWIYWCKGAFAEQKYDRPGREPFVTKAAHIFRCRPDAPRDPSGAVLTSAVEPVMTGGMDNPVDVAFMPGGERIFTTTFLVHPGGGQRDGLIHAIYGGVYGKPHGVLDGHPRTGDLMPVLVHLGAAAPCGLTSYESGRFGDEFRANLFACCFNMHKVTRHALVEEGATYRPVTEDFVSSSSVDFHPTDIIEDADGSLLIVDTGGWYKLCCPTSTLWKPDVLGAIYRIRRQDAPARSGVWSDPRGLKSAWDEASQDDLLQRLADPRPAVRERAMQQLAKLGPGAVPALASMYAKSSDRDQRRNTVWTLTRINDPAARAAVRSALVDADDTVKQAALNSVSLWRDSEAGPKLQRMLHADSIEARLAAEGIGRIGDRSAIADLLAAADAAADRPMQHAVIYALYEIGDVDALRGALEHSSVRVRRAAAIALDQLDPHALKPESAIGWLDHPDADVRESADWLLARHPEWGDALAETLERQLQATLTDEQSAALTQRLQNFVAQPTISALLANMLANAASPKDARLICARVMQKSSVTKAPPEWNRALKQALSAADHDIAAEAVAAARALPAAEDDDAGLADALSRAAEDVRLSEEVRLDALAALPVGEGPLSSATFDFVRQALNPDHSVRARAAALRILTRAKLSVDQRSTLAESFRRIGPLEASPLLEVFAAAPDDAVGTKLVAELRDSPALTSLRVDVLLATLGKFGPAAQRDGDSLAALINVDLAKQRSQLAALLGEVQTGNIRRGHAVFHSTKAACASCHKLGYGGGTIGPDLSKIGGIRTERDLLESILFPSASFVRSYEPVALLRTDGRVENGVIKDESALEVVLVKTATETLRIPRAEIEELRPGTVSIMPAGFGQQLSKQDLADLVVFLKSLQ